MSCFLLHGLLVSVPTYRFIVSYFVYEDKISVVFRLSRSTTVSDRLTYPCKLSCLWMFQDYCGHGYSLWERDLLVSSILVAYYFLYILKPVTYLLMSIVLVRMPMYSEMKLAFFVYLWYPKTKVWKHVCSFRFYLLQQTIPLFGSKSALSSPHPQGSDVVYDTFLRPIVMQYEPNIEQRLLHLRAKSGQLLSFYLKNFADKGTAFFMDVLRYVVSEKPEGSNAEVTTISPSDQLRIAIACTIFPPCSNMKLSVLD